MQPVHEGVAEKYQAPPRHLLALHSMWQLSEFQSRGELVYSASSISTFNIRWIQLASRLQFYMAWPQRRKTMTLAIERLRTLVAMLHSLEMSCSRRNGKSKCSMTTNSAMRWQR
jgi:hypothetical protein